MGTVRLACLAVLLALAPAVEAQAAETLAVSGVIGARGTEPGQLDHPIDLTLDAAGNVIVADTQNHRVQKFGPDGTLVWSRGKAGGSFGAGNGEFNEPKDVAVAPDGTILVADAGNDRIQRLRPEDGGFLAKYDLAFGPQGISVDADGAIFLADTSNNRVHRANAAGTVTRTWGGAGAGPGQFNSPFDVSAAGGFVYVADGSNHRVQKFTTDGAFVTAWGREGEKPGELMKPIGVSATSDGRVYVIDQQLARLDVYDSDGRFLLRFGHERLLDSPGGVYARGDQLVVADTGHSRILKLVEALAPPAGTFCDSQTGTCGLGPNGVPTVSMPSGNRSPVRLVNPRDACERLDRGTHRAKQAFFNGKTYPVQRVPEGFMVEIPEADLASGSVLVSWTCPTGGSGANAAQFSESIVNENWGDVSLYDPSGFVRDARTRRGIPGATVTLLSSPAFSGPFGFADPLSVSPRVNPQRTDRRGHYGWDVPEGFYRIRVERFGYRTLRASRIVSVPPPVTNLHVRLRPNPSEQGRLIATNGAVGRLRVGMQEASARRAGRRLRPRAQLRFRRGRLARVVLRSPRFRTGLGLGVGSTESALRLAHGRKAKRTRSGRNSTYRVGQIRFIVPRSNGASGKVRRVQVGR